MKKTKDGDRAHELETVVAAEFGDYLSRKLYVVEGREGLWRRVTKTPKKETEDPFPRKLMAWYKGAIVALVPFDDGHEELAEAGVLDVPENMFPAELDTFESAIYAPETPDDVATDAAADGGGGDQPKPDVSDLFDSNKSQAAEAPAL